MKNRFNLQQIADAYCAELGVDVPIMIDYLKAVFENKPYKEIEAEIVLTLKDKYDGNSEYFPDWKIINP